MILKVKGEKRHSMPRGSKALRWTSGWFLMTTVLVNSKSYIKRESCKLHSAWLSQIMQKIMGNLHFGLTLEFQMRLQGLLLTQKQHGHLTLTQEFSNAQWVCQFSHWVLTNWKIMTEKTKTWNYGSVLKSANVNTTYIGYFHVKGWISCQLLNSYLICRSCQHAFLRTHQDECTKYVKFTFK